MAKLFRTSGTGAQQQTLDTTDEKIKIYADDTALDTDLANIPDGEIVATKESAGGGGSGYVGEIPLGTWASFESDTAPNSEWLQAGTSFNANTYPALAMYLGGTTVPERFDHNRLEDYEALTITTAGITMPYDGVFGFYFSSSNGGSILVNNVAVTGGGNYGDSVGQCGAFVAFHKGDVLKSGMLNGGNIVGQVAYYKHPLFIKATPTSSDSDYEGTLNSIREFYVRNNTYSTEERLTGGVWIDGKPIYRLVSVANRTLDGSNTQVAGVFPQAIANVVDTMIRFTAVGGRDSYPGQSGSAPMTATFNAWQSTTDNKNIYCNADNRIYSTSVIVEYTKTTD